MKNLDLRTVEVTRYVQPLREGGSLPAIIEADDGFLYVMKFRGAGQGTKALVAELIGGELARAIGLNVPEFVFINLDDSFGKTEGDEEIQDLLKFSVGLNMGLHYLSGSITYDPLVSFADPLDASKVVLLDSIITNIDRTVKNTNLLNWNRELWLFDHGASLYFHHNWDQWETHIDRPFGMISSHVLLSKATELERAASEIKKSVTKEVIDDIIDNIPDDWLEDQSSEMTMAQMRTAYKHFINIRVKNIDQITQHAQDAR